MKVCFFGNYQRDYPRNRVLISGLEQNGVEVVECRTRQTGWRKYYNLYRRHKRLRGDYDALLVGFSGFTLVWFAKFLTSKPVFFDAFVSLYLTNVVDRQTCKPRSLKAYYYSFLDWWSCRLADTVLLDTHAQIDFFVNRYHIPRAKFHRIFVGADDSVYFPVTGCKPHDKSFIIHWHGHIVPFHGLNTVIAAAEQLLKSPNIEFRIVTRFNGKYKVLKAEAEAKRLNNIIFIPEVGYDKLAELINESDVCLGIFDSNKKAQVVIPNKIFEAIACAKPVITAHHQVILELFTDRHDIILVEAENPGQLAEKILYLKNNPQIRQTLAQNAFQLYQKYLVPKILGEELKHVLF